MATRPRLSAVPIAAGLLVCAAIMSGASIWSKRRPVKDLQLAEARIAEQRLAEQHLAEQRLAEHRH